MNFGSEYLRLRSTKRNQINPSPFLVTPIFKFHEEIEERNAVNVAVHAEFQMAATQKLRIFFLFRGRKR